MAVRSHNSSLYYEKIQPTVVPGTTQHANPDPFRPTRKGLATTIPNFPATASNSNAYMINRGSSPNDPAATRKVYLFVDSIQTGWQVTGDYAQTYGSKSWYPMNLSQDDLVIQGYTANQFEFDTLVRFVERSHFTALHGAEYSPDWNQFIDFVMFKPANSGSFDYLDNVGSDTSKNIGVGVGLGAPLFSSSPQSKAQRKINLGVVIENVAAGHERFQFAPAFTLTCKVIDDRTDPNRNSLYSSITDQIDYVQIFGDDVTVASSYTAETTPDPSPKKKPVTKTIVSGNTKTVETIYGP